MKLPRVNFKKIKTRKEKDQSKKENIVANKIFIVMMWVVIIACVLAAFLIIPEFFPSARTLISRSLVEQEYNNYISGKMDINIEATVQSDNGTYADIAVKNKVNSIVMNDGKSDIKGNIDINYADLAENNGEYEIMADNDSQSMYMYFKNTARNDAYQQNDDGYWYKLSPKEKESDEKNVPRIIRKTLKDIDNAKYDKEKMTVKGTITASRLGYILDYFEWFDENNMNLLQGISDATNFNITLQYKKNGYHNILSNITISTKNASAGDDVEFSKINIKMDIDNKTEGDVIKIPEDVKSSSIESEFSMPEPTPIESEQPEASLQDFMSLNIILDGQKVNSMESLRTLVSQSDRYTGWVLSNDGNLYQNSLVTDENAQILLYTNEADLVTQVEFNNIYAKKNSLNLLIGGLSLGCQKDKVIAKFGEPDRTISTPENDELHYYIGSDRTKEAVFTFYNGDKTMNSGLQKITIFDTTTTGLENVERDRSQTEDQT